MIYPGTVFLQFFFIINLNCPYRFTVLPNGSLHISEVYPDDQNKYGCTAGNSAGLNRKEVQLIVHGTFYHSQVQWRNSKIYCRSSSGRHCYQSIPHHHVSSWGLHRFSYWLNGVVQIRAKIPEITDWRQ